MAACEACWSKASWYAAQGKDGILSVADHYAVLVKQAHVDFRARPGVTNDELRDGFPRP